MVSCGEASGDLYAEGARRGLALPRPWPSRCLVSAAPRLRAAGADLVGSYAGVSVTGLVEAAAVLRRAWDMLRRLRDAAATRRPDVFVAIDFPDFNLRLAASDSRVGHPDRLLRQPAALGVASGPYRDDQALRDPNGRDLSVRARTVRARRRAGGVRRASARRPRDAHDALGAVAAGTSGCRPDRPVVALLPGSRPNEVRRILPVLAGAVPEIARRVPGVQFVVARAPNLDDDLFARFESSAASGGSASRLSKARPTKSLRPPTSWSPRRERRPCRRRCTVGPW